MVEAARCDDALEVVLACQLDGVIDAFLRRVAVAVDEQGACGHAVVKRVVVHGLRLVCAALLDAAAHHELVDEPLLVELDGGIHALAQRSRQRAVLVDARPEDHGAVCRAAVVGGPEEADLQQGEGQCHHQRGGHGCNERGAARMCRRPAARHTHGDAGEDEGDDEAERHRERAVEGARQERLPVGDGVEQGEERHRTREHAGDRAARKTAAGLDGPGDHRRSGAGLDDEAEVQRAAVVDHAQPAEVEPPHVHVLRGDAALEAHDHVEQGEEPKEEAEAPRYGIAVSGVCMMLSHA